MPAVLLVAAKCVESGVKPSNYLTRSRRAGCQHPVPEHLGPALAWASSVFSAPHLSRSISSASMRLASPYQMSLVRVKDNPSCREARRMAAFTWSPTGRGSAHRRTRDCASSIEETYNDFRNLPAGIHWFNLKSTFDEFGDRRGGEFA